MTRGVIFDMDGVLFDTERLAVEGWKRAGQALGYSIPPALMDRMRGRSVEDCRTLFEEFLGKKHPYAEARAIRQSYVRGWIAEHGVPLKPGVRELLGYLKQTQRKVALATSSGHEVAQRYLQSAEIKEFFDCILSGDLIERGKPEPDIFFAAAQGLGLPPGDCIVVEDSSAGLLAAHRAGCRPVFVPDLCCVDAQTASLAVRCEGLFGVQLLLEQEDQYLDRREPHGKNQLGQQE